MALGSNQKELTPELKSAIEDLFFHQRFILSSVGELGKDTGHRFFNPLEVYRAISMLKNQNLIPERGNFFDFGSGAGIQLGIAAIHGYNSYGIEYNPFLEKQTNFFIKNFREKGLIPEEIELKSLSGSYYPPCYIEKRAKNKCVAPEYEINLSNESTENIFFPCSSQEEIYSKLGKNLSDMDLFYAYSWSIQTPSLLEVFSIYSKTNAGFLLCSAGKHKDHAQLLEKLSLTSKKVETTNLEFVTKL